MGRAVLLRAVLGDGLIPLPSVGAESGHSPAPFLFGFFSCNDSTSGAANYIGGSWR